MAVEREETESSSGRRIRRRYRIITGLLALLSVGVFAGVVAVNVYPYTETTSRRLLYIIAGVSLLLTFGVLLFARSVFKSVLNPIDELREETASIDDGDLSVSVDTTREDEIGDVNRGFADLSQQVQSRIDEIEHALQTAVDLSEELETTADEFESVGETAFEAKQNISSVLDAETVETPDQDGMDTTEAEIERVAEHSIESLEDIESVIDDLNAETERLQQITTDVNYMAMNAGIEASKMDNDVQGFKAAADEVKDLSGLASESVQDVEDLHAEIRAELNAVVEELLRVQLVLVHTLTRHGEQLEFSADELQDTVRDIREPAFDRDEPVLDDGDSDKEVLTGKDSDTAELPFEDDWTEEDEQGTEEVMEFIEETDGGNDASNADELTGDEDVANSD